MSESITLTGMVLLSVPSGDYDRRVVLLTKERGKITAFARGARRQGSSLLGATLPFCFGQFRLFEGRTAYTLAGAQIDQYFSALKADLDGSLYGFYFMELAEYYGRENLDASMMLNLLYVSLKALENPRLWNRLVRYVYEIKLMQINGEFPFSAAEDESISETARYTISFILNTPLQKLYTFTVTQEVLGELAGIQDRIRVTTLDRKMKSLEMLQGLQETNERL